METIRLSTTLSAPPHEVYGAWISAKGHSAMTGSPATSEARVGGNYTACDGYIKGTHLVLKKGVRILQAWRTTEFPETAPDSRLEIRLAPSGAGTKLALLQSGIPDGQSEMYFDGWQELYFVPMKKYFDEVSSGAAKKPAKKAVKKPAKKAVKKPAKKKTATKASAAPKAPRTKRKSAPTKKKSKAAKKKPAAAPKKKKKAKR
jgi:uncharacterized protein YndB with AHSA1/START domain